MKKVAALAVCVIALSGCNAEVTTGPSSVSKGDLEKRVEGLVPDETTGPVDATCEGDLTAKVDATQDCHLEAGDENADVRVTVTSVDGSTTKFDAVPFIPTDRMADSIEKSLTDQGYQVASVDCEDELIGKLDEKATCTATNPDGGDDATLEVKVTEVHGLMVNFNYEVVS